MRKHEKLSKKFKERQPIIATNIVLLDSPPLLELINEPYLDAVIFDMEHGIFNNERFCFRECARK